jgi:hypothetical protein
MEFAPDGKLCQGSGPAVNDAEIAAQHAVIMISIRESNDRRATDSKATSAFPE